MVKWIMMCVELVDYLVIVSNELLWTSHSRQGPSPERPLVSVPFHHFCRRNIFSIRRAEDCGDIHGPSFCKNAPVISHILSADDCFY